jgi:hypothetical protein
LACLLLLPSRPWPVRRPVHRQRRPSGHGRRSPGRLPLCPLAALPVPSPAKRLGLCSSHRHAHRCLRRHPFYFHLPRSGQRQRSSQGTRLLLLQTRPQSSLPRWKKISPRASPSLLSLRPTAAALTSHISNAIERVNQELKRRTRVARRSFAKRQSVEGKIFKNKVLDILVLRGRMRYGPRESISHARLV